MKYLLLLSMILAPSLMTQTDVTVYQNHIAYDDIVEMYVDDIKVADYTYYSVVVQVPFLMVDGPHECWVQDTSGAYWYTQFVIEGETDIMLFVGSFRRVLERPIPQTPEPEDYDHEHSCSATTSGGGFVLLGLLLLVCVSYRRRVTA